MKRHLLILVFFATLILSCSKSDENEMDMGDPDPLTISYINGFVSTGSSTFQVTDLMANNPVSDIQLTSPFFVKFSKPVREEWLTNESLPKLLRTENGEPVEGITLNIINESNTELTLEPTELLVAGMTYKLVINPGYTALDGGILDDHVSVDFTTSVD